MIPTECKRLIEVDMPIRAVSESSSSEQNVRKGYLHSLHVWWATRPLAACRSVLLASLLPDPLDPHCPPDFVVKAGEVLDELKSGRLGYDKLALRKALFDFIVRFSTWESSSDKQLMTISKSLLSAAYPDGEPLVVDPFAGIGSIPFEALRIGADAFAGDLNPVAALLLKTDLELIPKYGKRLSDAVEKWGTWLQEEVRKKIGQFYPNDNDGSIPMAYIWARTILCEGTACGTEVPLVGMVWLSEKEKRRVALRYKGDKKNKKVLFEIYEPKSEAEVQPPIVNRFTATCPVCDYTTPYESVGRQLKGKKGGTEDARLISVICINKDSTRKYRLPNATDSLAISRAADALKKKLAGYHGSQSLIPNEPTPIARGPGASRAFSVRKYGMEIWSDAFTKRQSLALLAIFETIREAKELIRIESNEEEFAKAVVTCLSIAVSGTLIPYFSALSLYLAKCMETAFKPGNALPMRPDFAEANPLVPRLVGGLEYAINQVHNVLEHEASSGIKGGTVRQGAASSIPLPDGSIPLVATDPPYYDAIPYASLSDFCYVWLKRALKEEYPNLFDQSLTPKQDECILDPGTPYDGGLVKDHVFFENCIKCALVECRRILRTDGLAVVLFAHKSTAGWEALLNALVQAGWTVTASWPIETERRARMRAFNSAVLASSVFLVCRPRNGDQIGDWRQVLSELEPRVHSWMERLVKENIVGADAIFACLGPALEIYSRFSSVETAGGKLIELADKYDQDGKLLERGYLSHVWEAVAKEALGMIFLGADPAGFEEDSRLTAIWFWTIRTRENNLENKRTQREKKSDKNKSYPLEYDTARKIAQGLGAHLDELARPGGIIAIKGNVASMVPIRERRKELFGRIDKSDKSRRETIEQTTLTGDLVSDEGQTSTISGKSWTTLDRLHQSMILFADGRNEGLRRLLVDDGVGNDDRFWRLANSLSALYPKGSEEKRWLDGVLSRKKSLGF